MRKITMIVIFIVAMVMTTGCATKDKFWSNSYITGKIGVHEEEIGNINTQLKKLKEIDRLLLGEFVKINNGIREIKANLYSETTAVTVASKEVEEVEELIKKVTVTPPESKEAPVVKAQRLESLVPAKPKKVELPKKVKPIKITFDNLTKQQEIWVNRVSSQIDAHEKRLNAHDKQFAKMSDLQRRLAELEDEVRPVLIWTQPFPSGLPKKPEEKEKPQLPIPIEIQPGLNDLAIEILADRVELEKDVVGYADPRGKQKDNKELSERRAQASIDYLVSKLGPDKSVKWHNTTWKNYFVAVAGGETSRYGSFKHSRRVRFERTRPHPLEKEKK